MESWSHSMVAFQTRCPECNAKLRFDEPPDSDEAIECPRCGHVFDSADAKEEPKVQKPIRSSDKPRKKKKSGEKKDPKAPKKRIAKKKKANLFLLWMLLGATAVIAPALG